MKTNKAQIVDEFDAPVGYFAVLSKDLQGRSCKGCAFLQTYFLGFGCSNAHCVPSERQDNQLVIFKKIK
jgi:hypothetical protein